MQFSAILVAVLLPLVAASPLLPRQTNGTTTAGGATTQLTFTGAGASFAVTAPVDGTTFQIRKTSPHPPNYRALHSFSLL